MKCFEQTDKERLEKIASDLAKKADYDGLEILEISMLALTDVNFHPEAKVIRDLILKIENDPMGTLN
jgi:hypothetical protein|tara:strand:- start:2915 stop:3115 length:201 start_codon:yes stop_codon:yes gene_type:complete